MGTEHKLKFFLCLTHFGGFRMKGKTKRGSFFYQKLWYAIPLFFLQFCNAIHMFTPIDFFVILPGLRNQNLSFVIVCSISGSLLAWKGHKKYLLLWFWTDSVLRIKQKKRRTISNNRLDDSRKLYSVNQDYSKSFIDYAYCIAKHPQ